MYVPSAFAMTDRAELFAFMRQHSFALLVSTVQNEPWATHLPLLLDPEDGPWGSLRGHVARANPHARFLHQQPVLVVFSGPHAYISPTWYAAEGTVPTWNYVAVHAYGRCECLDEPESTKQLLGEMVQEYEAGLSSPWRFDPHGRDADRLVAAVVGFRIVIERLEGKWKLNQNHPPERQARVIAELEKSDDPSVRQIADMMQRTGSAR